MGASLQKSLTKTGHTCYAVWKIKPSKNPKTKQKPTKQKPTNQKNPNTSPPQAPQKTTITTKTATQTIIPLHDRIKSPAHSRASQSVLMVLDTTTVVQRLSPSLQFNRSSGLSSLSKRSFIRDHDHKPEHQIVEEQPEALKSCPGFTKFCFA